MQRLAQEGVVRLTCGSQHRHQLKVKGLTLVLFSCVIAGNTMTHDSKFSKHMNHIMR